jgi:2,4-dienoyl-CoA reductase-like NADH-dependent reductase (Old Yellow Enzyme family)
MTDVPVIAVGSVGLDTDVMDDFFGKEANSTGEAGLRELLRRFNNKEFDFISVGRGQIGDPHWVKKLREGRFSEVRMFTKKICLATLNWKALSVKLTPTTTESVALACKGTPRELKRCPSRSRY